MSFAATLYNCSDDPRTLHKTLPAGVPVDSITPTESCDILNPIFILSYKPAYTTCNYIIVGSPFNRSYFITDMKIDIGKKIVISCAVDVLRSYESEIGNIKTTIYRNEDFKTCAPYVADPEYQVKSGFQYYYETFKDEEGKTNSFTGANSENQYRYILSWVGHEISKNPNYYPINAEPSDWDTSWGDYYYLDNTGATPTYYTLLIPFPNGAPDFNAANTWAYMNFQSAIYALINPEE